ncbi:DUF4177 domain-containing protein [bacterium]|nr:DUF4177 domain-containing protein [bacterium]
MKEYKVISVASELSARKMAQQATMAINELVEEGWEYVESSSGMKQINIVLCRDKKEK